jgi:hypothetical protein
MLAVLTWLKSSEVEQQTINNAVVKIFFIGDSPFFQSRLGAYGVLLWGPAQCVD